MKWLSIIVCFGFTSAAAYAAPCYNNGEHVTLQGKAHAHSLTLANGSVKVIWFLVISPPVCVKQYQTSGNIVQEVDVSRVRIIGLPPPSDVAIELKGTLITSNAASKYIEGVAIRVISGRRIPAAITQALDKNNSNTINAYTSESKIRSLKSTVQALQAQNQQLRSQLAQKQRALHSESSQQQALPSGHSNSGAYSLGTSSLIPSGSATYSEVNAEVGCDSRYSTDKKNDIFNSKYKDHWTAWTGVVEDAWSDTALLNIDGQGLPDLEVSFVNKKAGYDLLKGNVITVRFMMKKAGDCVFPYTGDHATILR